MFCDVRVAVNAGVKNVSVAPPRTRAICALTDEPVTGTLNVTVGATSVVAEPGVPAAILAKSRAFEMLANTVYPTGALGAWVPRARQPTQRSSKSPAFVPAGSPGTTDALSACAAVPAPRYTGAPV